jgi:hypothetical protein
VKVATQSIAVVITFRKSNYKLTIAAADAENIALPTDMPAEHVVVNSLEFFPGNWLNCLLDVVS